MSAVGVAPVPGDRYPRLAADRAELDRALSALYDRLHAAQHAAEIAGEDDVAELLRALRTVVHTRLVHLAWGVPR